MVLRQALLYGALLAFLCLTSCAADDAPPPLVGTWQAYALEEEGRPLAVALEEIRFQFDADGVYRFSSTLNRREAGQYERKQDHLITRDTLRPDAAPKAVEIARLEADTLILHMQEGGQSRTLSLVRTP